VSKQFLRAKLEGVCQEIYMIKKKVIEMQRLPYPETDKLISSADKLNEILTELQEYLRSKL